MKWARGNNYVQQSIHDYLTNPGQPTHRVRYEFAQTPIDQARQSLLNGLGNGTPLADTCIIEIPILLAVSGGLCVTDTADSVNMLILGNRCLVPKPFGPVCANTYLFEHYIQAKLAPLGLNLTFLNDWQDFHSHEGEIHCGTNQVPLPLPANRAWWLKGDES